MPLADEKYPGGSPPLWRVIRGFAVALVVGLLVAYIAQCDAKERAPRRPAPSVEVTR